MPALVTASRQTSASSSTSASASTSAAKTFSRVNSFKREWGDGYEEAPVKTRELNRSSSGVVSDWPSSPETVKRKDVLVEYPKPANNTTMGETPADRRRKAILAAMSSNTHPPSSMPSSSTASSSQILARPFSVPSAQKAPPTQQLPSLPVRNSNQASQAKKRSLPWEEELDTAKKAMVRPGSAASNEGNQRSTSSSSATNIRQKLVLSSEQQQVLASVVGEGKNIFFTGSAGTGKSVLLREIIKNLRKKFATAPDAVAVTASTGIAACNIGGVTLHSFGGAGIAVEPVEVLVGKIKKNKKAAARWLRTKVLIIDEVSMVDAELFDKFCKIGQILRKNPNKPWGGIQIIVTGDFFQLPPVTKGNSMPKFCFEAATWDETVHLSVNLTKVFRQKDQRFVDMLNEMRFGRMTPASIQAFRQLSRPIQYNDSIEPTELFPRREDVERSNNSRLNQLNTDGWSYPAVDGGTITDPVQREKLLSNFLACKHISLKQGAQVMLIKNMDETLVNGSIGHVIGFCHKQFFDQDTSGKWVEFDLSELDEEDREKRLKTRAAMEAKLAASKPLPVVRFKIPGGGYRDQLIDVEPFKAELPNGEVQASRVQVPLILAWAMSIHKSQGQTLDRVKVDLSKVFEKGQAYVALSRATSLEGLQVLGFSADKVMAHRKVAQWSTNLRDLNA